MEGVPKAGRLTADLDPPGFDTLAVLMGGKKLEAEKVLLFRTPKPVEDPAATRARLHEGVQTAEKALREAHRDAERAESALAKANARVAAVEKQKQPRGWPRARRRRLRKRSPTPNDRLRKRRERSKRES